MKIISLLCFILCSFTGLSAPEDDFIMTIKTRVPNASDPFKFQVAAAGDDFNFNVDCNDDGVFEAMSLTASYFCDYTNSGGIGTYTIRIQDNSGQGTGFSRINSGINDFEAEKIMSLDQWGTGQWSSLKRAFYKADNVVILATDIPNLSAVTDLSEMFSYTDAANPDVSQWDVSSVTNMSRMFWWARSANPDVSNWDVSSVIDMSGMFASALSSNLDLSNWDVSSVIDMSEMFYQSGFINPDVTAWDVSSVKNMNNMFASTRAANPDVSAWDVSSVTEMNGMFKGARSANPDVSGWDVSSVIDMGGMFHQGSPNYIHIADPDVSRWDMSSVTNISNMFYGSDLANPDVSQWDVSSVIDMSGVFHETLSANPNVSHWDVSSVMDMRHMFADSEVADPNVSQWNVSSVTDMSYVFMRAKTANPDVSQWDVSSASDISAMFFGSDLANPDVKYWNVSSVTDMRAVFYATDLANPDVSLWDVSSVTDMTTMFAYALSANPDVSHWDVSSVVSMERMFESATSAVPKVNNWELSAVTDMSGMFEGIALPPWLYDAILMSFSQQTLNTGVEFDAGNSYLCEGLSQRGFIINNYGWTIQDSGLNCGSDVSIEFVENNQPLEYGQSYQQGLLVSNTGFKDATGASVTTHFSTAYANLTWTCQVIAGFGVCPAENGVGNLFETVDLQIDDQLNYVFSFDFVDDSELSAAADIQLSIPEDDIYLRNNFSETTNFMSKISKLTSGAWFDPENPGHGIFLEVLKSQENQADRLTMYWFTFHDSKPIWVGGVGEVINGEQVTIDLIINSGADFSPNFNAEDVVTEDWGQVTLNFQSPHSVDLKWDTLPTQSEFGSGEINYSQLSIVSESIEGCYSGSFYNSSQSGHGFYIHITDTANNQKQINVSWFSYHEGELYWLVGSGIFNQNGSNTLQLMQVTGASFFNPLGPNGWSFNSDDLVNTNWGNLTLTYADENNINIAYQPNDTSQFEPGEIAVTRLTSMKGHSCR